MSHFLTLLARTEADKWLNDNPLVMAAIFGVLGAVVVFTGVRNLITGQATSKWGVRLDGGMALFLAEFASLVALFASAWRSGAWPRRCSNRTALYNAVTGHCLCRD